jgi:hypothetical protein
MGLEDRGSITVEVIELAAGRAAAHRDQQYRHRPVPASGCAHAARAVCDFQRFGFAGFAGLLGA